MLVICEGAVVSLLELLEIMCVAARIVIAKSLKTPTTPKLTD